MRKYVQIILFSWFYIWAPRPVGSNEIMIAIFSRPYATQALCQFERNKAIKANEQVTACFNGAK